MRSVDVTASEVAAAVRDPDDDRVCSQRPTAVHEHVGVLDREVSVPVRAALAAAARSRGARTEYDGDLRAVEAELAEVSVASVDLAGARERVAETAEDVERLRERVARVSGRVEARRGVGDADAAAAEEALADANRELAAAETEHHAAQEALERARRRAREARDARERRLSLEDRLANLRRDARRALAERWGERFQRALAALPFADEPTGPDAFEGPNWVAGAAVARLAAPGAPLVVGSSLFSNATRASAALDAPVALVEV
nr:hypothetical protein [Halobacterium sp. TGN-42-S1]